MTTFDVKHELIKCEIKTDQQKSIITKVCLQLKKTANEVEKIRASVSWIDSTNPMPKDYFGIVKGNQIIVHFPQGVLMKKI